MLEMQREISRTRVPGLVFCCGLVAVLAGCATTEAVEPASSNLSELVSAGELAGRLGLAVAPLDDAGKVVLSASDGDSILLFVDTKIVSVHGQQYTTSEPIRMKGADAWIPGDDALAIESVWTIEDVERDPWVIQPLPFPRGPRGPGSGSPGAPLESSTYGDRATAAEVKAWTVPLRRSWRYIVIHHSAGSSGNAAQFHLYHKNHNGWDGLGYDFVIDNGNGGPDGAVEIGYRWRQQLQGAHAGPNNPRNADGIGICLVGDFTKTRPTAAQMRSLSRLCNFLSGLCRIPRENYLLHGDVRDTECPGSHFPRDFIAPQRAIERGTK